MFQTINAETVSAVRFHLGGSVQGLGFRPAIARLASALGLRGVVRNDSTGVVIDLEGPSHSIDEFHQRLTGCLPQDCQLVQIEKAAIACVGYESFAIETSTTSGPATAHVPVDRVVCRTCLAEVRGRTTRRSGYAFTSCTDCGPRYSIIESMPYDRHCTSMSRYKMCQACEREYTSSSDRRFHAQTNCCPDCGPRLWSTSPRDNVVLEHDDAIQAAANTLVDGGILALKGVGGYQLLCDATNDAAVSRLRRRKGRPSKPLAIMVDGIGRGDSIARLTTMEKKELASSAGPIVIVRSRSDSSIAESVHPGLRDVGILLPTTPLHALILDGVGTPLVATSGNVEGEPIEYREREAEHRLADVADRFLHHDRAIVRPIDDSVVRCMAGRSVTIRAGRGIAPLAINIATDRPMLAVGGQQKVALALNNSRQSILAPHLGELDSVASRQRFEEQATDVAKLYGAPFDGMVHDEHPDYFSSRWCGEQQSRRVAVQHHHAHMVAGMVEHDWLDQTVLGVAFDGSGLGSDGTIWGGEILLATDGQFKRVGHLRPFPLAGGEIAIHEPGRVAAALIDEAFPTDAADVLAACSLADRNLSDVLRLIRDRSAGPLTSSVGRLFDGVAAIAMGSRQSNYEGEPAMRLEAACDDADQEVYEISLTEDAPMQLDWRGMIRELVADRTAGVDRGAMAMRFHRGLAAMISDVTKRFPSYPIVLAGGVFQNRTLLELVARTLKKSGRQVGLPGRIPPNDGGLSVGQLAIAAAQSKSSIDTAGKERCV